MMNFLCILLSILSLFIGGSFTVPVPTKSTNDALIKYLTKFATDRHVPCFEAGYRTFQDNHDSLSENGWEWSNGGWADVENEVKCTPNTVLRVASVSKAIGSGLVASLVETGKLDWDSDISHYVPEATFPAKTWDGTKVSITLRELITHLSGVRDTTTEDLMHDWEFRITNSTQTVAFFAKDPLIAKPNTKFYYSNPGWNLIGAIVEAVEGRSYHLVLRDYMRKLGMKQAQMDTRLELVPHRGQHYVVTKQLNGEYKLGPAPIVDNLRPFPHWPCGGVITDVADLVTYASRMLESYRGWSGHFLNASTVAGMWNYQPPVHEDARSLVVDGHRYSNLSNRYVMGWDRVDFPLEPTDQSLSQLEMIFHVGAIGAASAIVAIFPGANTVVAAIANLGGISEEMPDVAAQMYHILANGK